MIVTKIPGTNAFIYICHGSFRICAQYIGVKNAFLIVNMIAPAAAIPYGPHFRTTVKNIARAKFPIPIKIVTRPGIFTLL